jgi:hypothetical protein
MRKFPIFLFMATVFLYPSLSSGYVPFAPIADMPENPGNDAGVKEAVTILQNAKFLERDEVGLPPYPDAKEVQTSSGEGDKLPMVMLISSDPVSQVVEFYRSKLEGWDYRRVGNAHIFLRDKSDIDLKGKIPTVQIGEAGLFKKLFPASKTEVRFWYNP